MVKVWDGCGGMGERVVMRHCDPRRGAETPGCGDSLKQQHRGREPRRGGNV